MACDFAPVRSARISVCPGYWTPAACSPSLCSGQVTIPSARPARHSSMAWTSQSYAARPAAADTSPSLTADRSAFDGFTTGRPAGSRAGSPTTVGVQYSCSLGHALATISGPIPATSPRVMSRRGAGIGCSRAVGVVVYRSTYSPGAVMRSACAILLLAAAGRADDAAFGSFPKAVEVYDA